MIIIRMIKLTGDIRALTCRDSDGNYNIYLNDALDPEGKVSAYQHELKHIENNDFDSYLTVGEIEEMAHEKNN